MKPRWETTYERWFQACVVIINRQHVTTHKLFPSASTLTFQTQDNRVCCYYLRFVDFNLCLVRLWMNKNMHFYLSLYFKLITSHLLRDKNKSCHVGEQWSSRDVSVMFHHQGYVLSQLVVLKCKHRWVRVDQSMQDGHVSDVDLCVNEKCCNRVTLSGNISAWGRLIDFHDKEDKYIISLLYVK